MSSKIVYTGLERRKTYDELVDYLGNHQESIKLPNRLASQIRDSPQTSNLLNGEISQHNTNVAAEQYKTAQIIEQAGEQQEAASVLRAAATQNAKPNITKTSQDTQTEPGVNLNDPNLDARVDQHQMDMDDAFDTVNNQARQQRAQYPGLGKSGLPTENPNNPAHVSASRWVKVSDQVGGASGSGYNKPPLTPMGVDPSDVEMNPESYIEPKGKAGRPRKNQSEQVAEPKAREKNRS